MEQERSFKKILLGVLVLVAAFVLKFILAYLLSDVSKAFDSLAMKQLTNGVFGMLSWILPFFLAGILNQCFERRCDFSPISPKLFFALFFSANLVANVAAFISAAILDRVGYVFPVYDLNGFSTENYFLFVFTMSIMVPLAEEFVFRKVILKSFLPFGKTLSIVLSSMIFAICHDISSLLYAFVFGMLLGYLAVNFGHKYAVAVHILNNLISSSIIVAEMHISAVAFTILFYARLICMLALGIVSFVILIKSRSSCEKNA